MTTNEDATLLCEIEAPLAWVIVNRPQARNALNLAVWRGLAEHMQLLAARHDLRVVILRGAGHEAFLSGADITEFPQARANSAMTAEYDRQTHTALEAITAIDKPVIAMINGLCFGGGCSVALACDLRFAARQARFAIPAVRLGLAYPFEHGVRSLVDTVGRAHAADLLLSGRALSADEAQHMGLVNRVFDAEHLVDETRAYALHLATAAPLTVAAHKLAIREALQGNPDRSRLQAANERCFNSEDYREGVAAFLEKRKPRFRGR